MSAETLKAAVHAQSGSIYEYLAFNNNSDFKRDLLALIEQERKEAVQTYRNSIPSSFHGVDRAAKQRLDEFTRAILPAIIEDNPMESGGWITTEVRRLALAQMAKRLALAQMAENDKP